MAIPTNTQIPGTSYSIPGVAQAPGDSSGTPQEQPVPTALQARMGKPRRRVTSSAMLLSRGMPAPGATQQGGGDADV